MAGEKQISGLNNNPAVAFDDVEATDNNAAKTYKNKRSDEFNLFFQTFAGNPNGNVAGSLIGQFCVDTSNKILYRCTTTGNASSAVWTLIAYLVPSNNLSDIQNQGFAQGYLGMATAYTAVNTNGSNTLVNPMPALVEANFSATSNIRLPAFNGGISGQSMYLGQTFELLNDGIPFTLYQPDGSTVLNAGVYTGSRYRFTLINLSGQNGVFSVYAIQPGINTISGTTYTLSSLDDGNTLMFTSSSGCTVTIPQTSNVSLKAGFRCNFLNNSTGVVTFVGQGTDILIGSTTANPNANGLIEKVVNGSPNTWNIAGGTNQDLRELSSYLGTPVNGSGSQYYIDPLTANPGTMVKLVGWLDSGSCTVNLNNGATTGIATLAVTSTPASVSISSSNTFTAGTSINYSISSATSPLGLHLILSFDVAVSA